MGNPALNRLKSWCPNVINETGDVKASENFPAINLRDKRAVVKLISEFPEVRTIECVITTCKPFYPHARFPLNQKARPQLNGTGLCLYFL
jgi:hypothetical protein